MTKLTKVESELIDQYNQDFFKKTGKKFEVKVLTKWETQCKLDVIIKPGELYKWILKATGWKPEEIFVPKNHQAYVFKRQIIYYILYNNGILLREIAKLAGGKDHTHVLSNLKSFEYKLDTEKYIQRALLEIVDYIKLNINSVTIN